MAKKDKNITPEVENTETNNETKQKQSSLSPTDYKNLADTMLRKSARNINREYRTKRMLGKMVFIIVTFFLLCYGALLISRSVGGNFEISLSNARRMISLSADASFDSPTDSLQATIPSKMINISYTGLPFDELGTVDGNDNGENYMCYTFYLKNRGNRALDYYCTLNITNIENELDECIRVMIIRNEEKFFYAKKNRKTGEPEQLYYYDSHALFDEIIETTAFIDEEKGFDVLREGLNVDEVDKYSIIVWIEGSDPDTVDDCLSGIVQMKLNFTVKDVQEDD